MTKITIGRTDTARLQLDLSPGMLDIAQRLADGQTITEVAEARERAPRARSPTTATRYAFGPVPGRSLARSRCSSGKEC
jgi:hypothetical protein